MFEWTNWWGTLVAIGFALLVNLVLGIVVRHVGAGEGARTLPLRQMLEWLHPRIQLLVFVVALWVAAGLTAPARYEWWDGLSRVFYIAAVLAGAWLLAGIASFGIERMLLRYASAGEALPQIRRMRTQLQVVRRLANVLIAIIAIGVVLFSFPEVRAVGTSVLASAGIVSIIAGLAAQSTLGNLIAGIQLAFSNAIRVGDVVVVEDEWGRIGEITLSYVVVHIWDDRRLVLPCTYFTSQPYETWTRDNDRIMGTVYLDLDWRVPVDELRAKYLELLKSSELWDGRAGSVAVTGSQGGHVTVRLLLSTSNSDDQASLIYLVREEMVTWLQREHPEALPTSRVLLPTSDAG